MRTIKNEAKMRADLLKHLNETNYNVFKEVAYAATPTFREQKKAQFIQEDINYVIDCMNQMLTAGADLSICRLEVGKTLTISVDTKTALAGYIMF